MMPPRQSTTDPNVVEYDDFDAGQARLDGNRRALRLGGSHKSGAEAEAKSGGKQFAFIHGDFP